MKKRKTQKTMGDGKWKMENGNDRSAPSSILHPPSSLHPSFGSPLIAHRSSFIVSSAFTLTEILVVIVIIVLMLAMAMPVFHTLTGSRSEESASNQIAGMLGRARSEAIGLQAPRGILFYTDAASGRTAISLVESKSSTASGWQPPSVAPPYTPPAYPRGSYISFAGNYWVSTVDIPAGTATPPSVANTNWCAADVNVVDQTLDSDAELLPAGVGAQLINDWGMVTGVAPAPASDAYVSIGAIMFDAQGRLANIPISVCPSGTVGLAMQMSSTGSHNYPEWGSANGQLPGVAPYYRNQFYTLYSSFGIVLFQKEAFQSLGFDPTDPTYAPHVLPKSGSYIAGTPSEKTEESWLDQNATPLLINRFNGTLVKGE